MVTQEKLGKKDTLVMKARAFQQLHMCLDFGPPQKTMVWLFSGQSPESALSF